MIRQVATAVAATLMTATAAMAADVAPPPLMAPPAPPAPTFSWDRYYVGVYTGAWDGFGAMLGVSAGRNFAVGEHLVLGLDFRAGAYDFSAIGWEAYALGRVGVAFNRTLIYGGFGAGWDIPGPTVAVATAGVEVGIGANASIRGEFELYDLFGVRDIGGLVGFAWHFGQ